MILPDQRYICNQQKELYEYVQSRNIDIRQFSDEFMNSYFCNYSIDKEYSVDQFADIVNWLEFLEKEFPIIPCNTQENRVSVPAAGWIGFEYRYLHFVTGLASRTLAIKAPVDRLIIAYPGLHTVDEDMAADIIISDFSLKKGVSEKLG